MTRARAVAINSTQNQISVLVLPSAHSQLRRYHSLATAPGTFSRRLGETHLVASRLEGHLPLVLNTTFTNLLRGEIKP